MSAPGSVVDIFCGAGALSHGFLLEGFRIAAGFDLDPACRAPFELNNGAPLVKADIRALAPAEIAARFEPGLPRILAACAPCQPFSTYSQGPRRDGRWALLAEIARLTAEIRPDVLVMENVAQLARFRGGRTLELLVRELQRSGYRTAHQVVNCPDYGVPQTRRRLVLLAARGSPPAMPAPLRRPGGHPTVADAIGGLPPIAAGAGDPDDQLHLAAALSGINLRRIRASRPGGTWRDWPPELVSECHRRPRNKGYASVYGRMSWDAPAPTITTQYHTYGCGRFGHPEQDRALTLREGALLQTFPRDYAFTAPGEPPHIRTVGRLVGNAVPVDLARAIARTVAKHLSSAPPTPGPSQGMARPAAGA